MEINFLEEQLACFGIRLKALRQERRWTLDALAEHSGFSKGYLSRLESGDRQASIAAVLTLSRLFGVSLASMFEGENAEPVVIVRNGGTVPFESDGLTCFPLSAGSPPLQMQPMRVVVSPGREGDVRRRHDGEEWIYVLSGSLTLLVGSQAHHLGAGDAAHFDARLPHRLVSPPGAEAEVLLVAAPGRNQPQAQPAAEPRFS
jgi:quercetin dioxygenase-like cupin family protein